MSVPFSASDTRRSTRGIIPRSTVVVRCQEEPSVHPTSTERAGETPETVGRQTESVNRLSGPDSPGQPRRIGPTRKRARSRRDPTRLHCIQKGSQENSHEDYDFVGKIWE